jgi:hypothetical protein
MTKNNAKVAQSGAGASAGARQQNPAVIDVDYYDIVRHVLDRIAMVVPTFTITLKVRDEMRIEIKGEVAEIGHNGITLISGDRRLDIDPRYNSAVEERRTWRRHDVVVAEKVRYRGTVYEAKEFVELFKKRAKELMEEAAATVGL